jgi:hypothetical protein
MSKPVLLSGGNGKVSELAGTESRQVLTWSQTAEEWTLGPGVGGSGGGGELFYLNDSTAPDAPTTNIPTGASGETVKELGTVAAAASTTVLSTASVPVLPAAPELIIGFVTDLSVPNATEIPAGLWEFNVWAEATGNTTNQSYIQAKVYKYDGVNAPTAIATSASVFIYDPGDVTQYTLSVLIPGGVTLLATDRIYVEILCGATTSNRQVTLYFGNSEPSHVHTTIFVPINLGTDVTGTLPVANGGTGVTSASANTVFAGPTSGANAAPSFRTLGVAEVTGAAPLASPTFTGTPLSTTAAADTNTTQIATTAYVVGQASSSSPVMDGSATIGTSLKYARADHVHPSDTSRAPLASPTFTGTPSLPTGTTGVTQSAGNNTTALATTAFVTAAVAASSGIPYDLPCEIPGTPPTSTKVVNFEAVRAFTLAATGHQGGQLTAPSGNFVCTVRKNATSIGTITFGTSSFSHSITATSFAAGDVLSVETPASALGIDTPFATFFMTLA